MDEINNYKENDMNQTSHINRKHGGKMGEELKAEGK
tara:strand:+ start:467 stop:574 length:108 start_codon:yes stop_codon:yes gene_type:complete